MYRVCPVWFQFHNGSIKRVTHRLTYYPDTEFQFHNGSIKSFPQYRAIMDPAKVSIPQWFD